jgi:hypothetical protein
MQKLEVGKPYQEGLKRIPEGRVFNFNKGGGTLKIIFDSPLDYEIGEINQGKIEIGLLEKEGIIFFFIKFGELPWMEALYHVDLSESFDLMELTDENKDYALQIVLIDGMTGIVNALKLIGPPYTMSKRFKELVEKQRKTHIQDFDTVLNKIYSKYDTDALVEEAETYFL